MSHPDDDRMPCSPGCGCPGAATSPEPRGPAVAFDSTDEGIPQATFDWLRNTYWVLAFKNEEARPTRWLLSPGRPLDVPNGCMVWRRPTYAEALRYADAEDRGDGHLAEYRTTRGDDPPVCVCGHRESSHQPYSRILGLPPRCRMTCRCSTFREAPR